MKLVAANRFEFHMLDVSFTYGNITDSPMMLAAKNCRQLQALIVRSTNGKITDESVALSLLVLP